MTMIILMIIYPQYNDNDNFDDNLPSGTPSPSDFRLRQCRSHGIASHSVPLPDDGDHHNYQCDNYHHDDHHHYYCCDNYHDYNHHHH